MIAPVRTFISYQQPLRCRRTAVEMVATFAVSCLGLTIAALSINTSPALTTFVGGIGLLIGIVAFIIGCSLLWPFATAHMREVHVTDAGVRWDGKEWPWDSVISIRSTTVLPNGAAYLSVTVNRGRLRSRLTLPIEVRDNDPTETINGLRQYLIETGYTIPWRSSAA